MARALINVPTRAKRGAVIELRTLLSHPMETGFRPNASGVLIPRDIVTSLACTYNGAEIFYAEIHPALAANPYIAFHTIATESGTIVFTWKGDHGFVATESVTISVE